MWGILLVNPTEQIVGIDRREIIRSCCTLLYGKKLPLCTRSILVPTMHHSLLHNLFSGIFFFFLLRNFDIDVHWILPTMKWHVSSTQFCLSRIVSFVTDGRNRNMETTKKKACKRHLVCTHTLTHPCSEGTSLILACCLHIFSQSGPTLPQTLGAAHLQVFNILPLHSNQ